MTHIVFAALDHANKTAQLITPIRYLTALGAGPRWLALHVPKLALKLGDVS
jgi:hypothetical protein